MLIDGIEDKKEYLNLVKNIREFSKLKLSDDVPKRFLCIDIPGTGGEKQHESNTIGLAFKNIRSTFKKYYHCELPFVPLEPVGGSGESYSSLSSLPLESIDFGVYSFSGKKNSQQGLMTSIFGLGEQENNAKILSYLRALDEDKLLPTHVIIGAWSRGAPNAISMANEIFIWFPNMQVHLLLLDPVPGPFQEIDYKKRVIPWNTQTLTMFYAQDEDSIVYTPLDWSCLVLSNPGTTVSSYAVKMKHREIVSPEVYFKAKCISTAFELILEGILSIPSFTKSLWSLKNNSDFLSTTYARKNCYYVVKNEINSILNDVLKKNITYIREKLDPEPTILKNPCYINKKFYTSNIDTLHPEKRRDERKHWIKLD